MKKEEMLLSVRCYLSQFGKLREHDEKILNAISEVDRKFFVPKEMQNLVYVDNALAIEEGQTISQPSTVARMLSILGLKKGDNVLEIGAGSGWNACLIAWLVAPSKVLSLEIIGALIKKTKERIARTDLNFNNLEIKKADFRKLKEKFDKIIFTAGLEGKINEKIIEDFAKQHLNNNGILVCPMQHGPLIVIKKDKFGKITKTYSGEEYVFVPLVLD